jgi:biopolymer transport protein ExbD
MSALMKQKSFLQKLKPISIGASMADMALLLLVFFMAATSTEPPRGVEVELPSGQTRGADQDSLYLTVSAQGNVYFDGRPVTLNDLGDSLAMRQGEKDRVVSITADRNLPYHTINGVIDVLRDQDFLNYVFMAQPRKEKGVAP